jgi:hypothetical protein
VDVDRAVDVFEQGRDALDGVAHHRAADVIGVIVRGEGAGDGQPVGGDQIDQFADGVRGIDEQALAGRSISDRVDEVDHLCCHGVVDGEVPS